MYFESVEPTAGCTETAQDMWCIPFINSCWTVHCWNGLCASNFARQALNRPEKFNILAIQTQQPTDDGLSNCLPVKPGKNIFHLENQIHTHIAWFATYLHF